MAQEISHQKHSSSCEMPVYKSFQPNYFENYRTFLYSVHLEHFVLGQIFKGFAFEMWAEKH
jgi:hypothetical protein